MTIPPTTDAHDAAPATDANSTSAPTSPDAQRRRPAGFIGGHTVQDWEQPAPSPALVRTTASPPAEPSSSAEVVADPSPPTTALYLRPAPAVHTEATAEVVAPEPIFDAKTQTLTAQSAAFVDAITRGLSDALALQLRPAVASAVDALLPMILSLGNTPEGANPTIATADVAAPVVAEPASAPI
ncbi:MAG: hypothetical protein WC876_06865 [Candidatus Thermoplasmatota archaeon]|jgi:hypothetical protein